MINNNLGEDICSFHRYGCRTQYNFYLLRPILGCAMFFFFFFFLSWVNWLRGCSSIPMDVLPRLFIGPILVILFKNMCICTVHHKNLYHAKSSNINLCFSDSKTFGSSCNWSYSGLMLSWRSGIKCCNIHIQGKCCTLCSYDNVCLKCIPLFVCLFFLILY